MVPDEILFEHMSDREVTIHLFTRINSKLDTIDQRLRDGSIIINNHENAIRELITRTECCVKHKALNKSVYAALTLLVVIFLGILGLIIKK